MKIPPGLNAKLLELAGSGKSAQELAGYLQEHHGVKVTGRAINKRLASLRAGREEISRAVVREQLAGEVLSDLDVLRRTRLELEQLAARLLVEKKTRTYLHAIDRLVRVTYARLRFAGVEPPAPDTDSGVDLPPLDPR